MRVSRSGELIGNIMIEFASAIASLARNPRPKGAIKLTNREAYRIRAGDFRIIYEIQDNHVRVIVVDVGHRRDIYD